jgi:hypothetical protein
VDAGIGSGKKEECREADTVPANAEKKVKKEWQAGQREEI